MSTTERIGSFSRGALRFDVLDDGPLDGDPIVLLHGFPERATSWRLVTPVLHAAGLRTLAPDQRGYSPGARPRGRRAYRSTELADDVAALIDAIGRPVHLAGHDWGAAVGWAVAAHRADLVRTWTALSVPHPMPYARSLLGRQGLKSWYMAYFNLPWVPERLMGLLEGQLARSGMTAADLDRFRTEIVEYGALPGALGWYRAMPFTRPVPRVSVPTTMVWSDGDIAIDRAGVDACGAWATGSYDLRILAGVTHWIPTQAPEAAADAILSRVTAEGCNT